MNKLKNFKDIKDENHDAVKTNNERFDEFVSSHDGLVRPSHVLLTGTSGAGKTTFCVYLQKIMQNIKTAFYSREMPASAVKKITKNMNVDHENAFIADEAMCSTIDEFMEKAVEFDADVIIIDSLQVASKDYQDKYGLSRDDAINKLIDVLNKWKNENDKIAISIGHVTKEGQFRGDNTIMQMVDAHIEMIHHKDDDGSRTISVGEKNRFGNPDKKLFYEIDKESEDSIKFYRPSEYRNEENSNNLLDKIAYFIGDQVKLHKGKKGFSKMKRELKKGVGEIEKTKMSRPEKLKEIITLSDKKLKEYGFNDQ